MSKARQTVYTDPGKNLDLVIRKSRNATLTFRFLDTEGSPYPIEDDFSFAIKRDNRSSSNILLITNSGSLVIADNTIQVPFTESNTNIDGGREYYWELKNLTIKQNWVQGRCFVITGESSDQPTTEASIPVNLGDTVVNVEVTLGGGSESVFESNPTLVLPSGFTFGKYQNGDTPNWTGLTAIEAILDAIIDYIAPVFTSFSVTGQSATVEVGTTLSGSKTFTWGITENSGDVDTIDIYDITAGANLVSNTTNDGSQAVNITSKQLNSNGATQQWRGVAHDTGSQPSDINSSTFTVTARYYRFFGPTDSSPANSAAVRALPSSAFQTGSSFDMETGTDETKFVIALPPGVTISSVVDLDALNANITSEFTLTNINVQDAGGTNRSYNVYEMNVGAPYGSSHTFRITTA